MINGNKPEEIDFSDKNSDNVIHNMDYLMNQTMTDRENELKSITTKYNTDNKTMKWINNDNENNIVKLNIKDDVVDNNLITPIQVKKKVTFKVEEKNSIVNNKVNTNFDQSFLLNEIRQLKEAINNTKTVSNEINSQKFEKFSQEVLSTLDSLLDNQKKILNIIDDKNKNDNIVRGTSIFGEK